MTKITRQDLVDYLIEGNDKYDMAATIIDLMTRLGELPALESEVAEVLARGAG